MMKPTSLQAVHHQRPTPSEPTPPPLASNDLAWTTGNHIQFYQDNSEAFQEYMRLIQGAQSFISVENFNLESDQYGKAIMDALIERAHEGIRIRIVVDGLSKASYGSEEGYVWLKQNDIARLRAEPNIELVIDDPIEWPKKTRPGYGPMVFMHRKWLVTDIQDSSGQSVLTAFGGERVMSSISFGEARQTQPRWYESMMGLMIPSPMGWGQFEDVSWVIQGPVVESIHQTILNDFISCGGEPPPTNDPSQKNLSSNAEAPGTDLAYVTQEAKRDTDCEDEWLRILQGAIRGKNDAEEIIIANSFTPDEKNQAAMITAAQSGKHVIWITGGLFYKFGERSRVAAKLYKAGVDIRIIPNQLHIKIIANSEVIAAGSSRMDKSSAKSYESLLVMKRGDQDITSMEKYLTDLKSRSISLADTLSAQGFTDQSSIHEIARIVRQVAKPPKAESPSLYYRANSFSSALLNSEIFLTTLVWPSRGDPAKESSDKSIYVSRDLESFARAADSGEQIPVAKTNLTIPDFPLPAEELAKLFFPTHPDEVALANEVMTEFGEMTPQPKGTLMPEAQSIDGNFFSVTRHLGWPFKDKNFNMLVHRKTLPNGTEQVLAEMLTSQDSIKYGLPEPTNPYRHLQLTINIVPQAEATSTLTMAYAVNPGMGDFVPMSVVSQKTESDTRHLLKKIGVMIRQVRGMP